MSRTQIQSSKSFGPVEGARGIGVRGGEGAESTAGEGGMDVAKPGVETFELRRGENEGGAGRAGGRAGGGGGMESWMPESP